MPSGSFFQVDGHWFAAASRIDQHTVEAPSHRAPLCCTAPALAGTIGAYCRSFLIPASALFQADVWRGECPRRGRSIPACWNPPFGWLAFDRLERREQRDTAVLKFLELVLKNLGRNRVRTLLTGFAVLTLATIFSVVSNTTAFIGQLVENAADTRLVIREKWMTPSRVPSRYARMIADIPASRIGRFGTTMAAIWTNRIASTVADWASPRGWKTCARCSPVSKTSTPPSWRP